jgi:hypothetical protein
VRYRIIPIYYVASHCSLRAATTHWSNLADRFQRGVDNPCPALLIGPPSSIVTFGEDPKTIAALIEGGAAEQLAAEIWRLARASGMLGAGAVGGVLGRSRRYH